MDGKGAEGRAARSPTRAAEVATSSTPAASITSQAAGSSKGRKQDLQHGRCDRASHSRHELTQAQLHSMSPFKDWQG